MAGKACDKDKNKNAERDPELEEIAGGDDETDPPADDSEDMSKGLGDIEGISLIDDEALLGHITKCVQDAFDERFDTAIAKSLDPILEAMETTQRRQSTIAKALVSQTEQVGQMLEITTELQKSIGELDEIGSLVKGMRDDYDTMCKSITGTHPNAPITTNRGDVLNKGVMTDPTGPAPTSLNTSERQEFAGLLQKGISDHIPGLSPYIQAANRPDTLTPQNLADLRVIVTKAV